MGYDGQDYDLPALTDTSFARRVGTELEAIRTGHTADAHGWMVAVNG